MDTAKIGKFLAVFLVVFMATIINLPESMMAQLGFDPSYLTAALVAVAISGMIVERRAALVILVLGLCVLANLPDSTVAGFGIAREWVIAALIAVVVVPLVTKTFGSS